MDYPKRGFELDRLIAEKVLGWSKDALSEGGRDWGFYRFSTDIGAAWELAEKFGLCVIPFEGGWTAFQESKKFHQDSKQNAAPTASHAICLAALNTTKAEPEATACIITYQENILRCVRYKTRKENYETVRYSLNVLLGKHLEDKDFKEDGGTVEFYRSVG